MKAQRYQVLMKFPIKEEQTLWKHHLHLCLIDMAMMIVGAWILLAIGHIIFRITMALLE